MHGCRQCAASKCRYYLAICDSNNLTCRYYLCYLWFNIQVLIWWLIHLLQTSWQPRYWSLCYLCQHCAAFYQLLNHCTGDKFKRCCYILLPSYCNKTFTDVSHVINHFNTEWTLPSIVLDDLKLSVRVKGLKIPAKQTTL